MNTRASNRLKPLIGVTTDLNTPIAHRSEAEYSVRCNYVDALTESGAVSVILPCDITALPTYLEICDGFLVTGSQPGNTGGQRRRSFEFALINAALEKNVPILGICNGMQMLGQALGGTMVECNSNTSGNSLDHKPAQDPTAFAHEVELDSRHRLGKLTNEKTIQVNSFHLQALLPEGQFEIAARSSDEMIEAIVLSDRQYCVGVQWHPEYLLTSLDHLLFKDFVSECRITKMRRKVSLT